MSSRSIWLHGRRGLAHASAVGLYGRCGDSRRIATVTVTQRRASANAWMALANMPRRSLSLSECGFDSGSSVEQG